ncbi:MULTISPECIES: antitoxin Xre/MbcA/ParS toxin-binding domain-containing protein [unclassified Pseudomonas]|uniref:antitoxin Xre/MbcA/ParS toxin-binding domain-containing protein n=1 Tax=unclassified Pseudomonas TaxID=196821 RepID=UPI0009DD668E
MLAIDLLGPCSSANSRCWSIQFRCFVARKDQVRSQAAFVLGNDRLASDWLTLPAVGLERRSPCSLLADNEGYRHVCEYLVRINYGVY